MACASAIEAIPERIKCDEACDETSDSGAAGCALLSAIPWTTSIGGGGAWASEASAAGKVGMVHKRAPYSREVHAEVRSVDSADDTERGIEEEIRDGDYFYSHEADFRPVEAKLWAHGVPHAHQHDYGWAST